MNYLERLLTDLDPDSGLYLGQPHGVHSHCVGDSGFILSQRALGTVVSLMDSCLEDDSLKGTPGDEFLGVCIKEKLHATCSPLGKVSEQLFFT